MLELAFAVDEAHAPGRFGQRAGIGARPSLDGLGQQPAAGVPQHDLRRWY
ncbi:MAG TPA: hypothetical protein VE175_13670 [Woeseiaceae bacterium]|nr:hypothetical protein [Woeseiaceae bacterium]